MKNFTFLFLLRLAVKYLYVLILSAVLFFTMTYFYFSFMVPSVYKATGSILVTNGGIIDTSDLNLDAISSDRINNTDVSASMNISDTIVDILNTNGIYKELSEKTGNKFSYQDLSSKTSITRKDTNSLFIYVTISSSDPKEAVYLVNEFLEIAPAYIESYVPGCASAITPSDNASKTVINKITFSILAAGIAALAAFGIIILIYSTNTIIQTKSDFSDRFDIPIIGTIPDFEKSKSDKAYTSYGTYTNGGYVDEK